MAAVRTIGGAVRPTSRLPRRLSRLLPTAALNAAATFWLAVAIVGQWAFFAYILAFYGPSTVTGDFASWTRNALLFRGYQPGDTTGNLTFLTHALLGGIVTLGGTLQLIPQVRNRFPVFHRWTGRVFMVTALGLSLGGLYLVWVRGTGQSVAHDIAITGNAVAILTCGVLGWRTALCRDWAAHRRWALRLYLVANAQWFTRVGFVAWSMITLPLGLEALQGPFFLFWSFGCYLVPLAVLELYLRTKDSGGPVRRYAMAGGLTVLTLLMAIGILGFSLFMFSLITGIPMPGMSA